MKRTAKSLVFMGGGEGTVTLFETYVSILNEYCDNKHSFLSQRLHPQDFF